MKSSFCTGKTLHNYFGVFITRTDMVFIKKLGMKKCRIFAKIGEKPYCLKPN
jgi:hypothetical protein